jgi:ferredoxin, 2Fe-2S
MVNQDRVDQPRHSHGGTALILPAGIELTTCAGETVFAAADRLGYRWPTLCGGNGTCRVCAVEVRTGAEFLSSMSTAETEAVRHLSRNGSLMRLACQLRIHGPVTLRKFGVRRGSDDLIGSNDTEAVVMGHLGAHGQQMREG